MKCGLLHETALTTTGYNEDYDYFKRGSKEYSYRDYSDNQQWRFVDIADEKDMEVYEIKSRRQGVDKAQREAQKYVDDLNLLCTFGPKRWVLGREFDHGWVTEGGGERVEGWCDRPGVILYEIEYISLTTDESSSSDESMDESSSD